MKASNAYAYGTLFGWLISAPLLFGGCNQTTSVKSTLYLSTAKIVDKTSTTMVSRGGGSSTTYYLRTYASGQVYDIVVSKEEYAKHETGDSFTVAVPVD